jgi:hypothetical protein
MGVGKEHPQASPSRSLEQAALGNDVSQGLSWMGSDMQTQQSLGIDPGEERCLACSTLWQARHAETGIKRAAGEASIVLGQWVPLPGISYSVGQGKGSTQQVADMGHWHLGKRVIWPRRRQPYPINKDKENPVLLFVQARQSIAPYQARCFARG